MSRTESIPLKLQLATAKEAMGDFKGAIELYEAAGECDGMVRLLLEAMSRTDLAIEIVDRTRSQEGAKMVAAYVSWSVLWAVLDDYSIVFLQAFHETKGFPIGYSLFINIKPRRRSLFDCATISTDGCFHHCRR